MKIEMVFLRSRVARRIFFLFIVSALMPVALLAILSYGQIVGLLTGQEYSQIKQANKSYGIALLDRLLLLDQELDWISASQALSHLSHATDEAQSIALNEARGFRKLIAINSPWSTYYSPRPDSNFTPVLSREQQVYLQTGKAILMSDDGANEQPRVYLLRLLDPSQSNPILLLGEIDLGYLFGDADILGQEKELCVVNESQKPLFCSTRAFSAVCEQLPDIGYSASAQYAWNDPDDHSYLISYWSLFLKPSFHIQQWTIVTRKSTERLLAPVEDFELIFAFVLSLTIAITALLSVHQIRKSLIPLERIMLGVKQIANKTFDAPVAVDSDDEFEELADSVNQMALKIDRQFQTLTAMADIDHLILSTLKIEDILKIVLARAQDIIPHDHISMILIECDVKKNARCYTRSDRIREGIAATSVLMSEDDYRGFAETDYVFIDSDHALLPDYLLPLRDLGSLHFLVFPITVKEAVTAIICLGYRHQIALTDEDLLIGCDFANRVAVALTNARWEEQLYYMAHYDALTGLPNRLLLRDRLQRAIARAERHFTFLAVLFIDLDRFKQVNDSLGHLSGDLLLREVGDRFSRSVKTEDTVSRIGGDEFVIVVQEFQQLKEALATTTTIANRLLYELSQPFKINDREIFSTASIGIACYPTDGETASELLKNADAAMYHAKAKGKNNYQFYSSVLNAEALERLDLENSLRCALARDELEIYYQPKVETNTRRICGAEALLRWNHPQRGRVSPAYFIPMCEELGLIVPIGEWIIRSVCQQLKRWSNQGLHEIHIAINLSPVQFCQPDLIAMVKRIISETEIDSVHLEFEITESAAMENIDKTIAILDALHAMGIALSIDDFGTGYSSLSYLKRFPVHSLKIDQSFIRHLVENAKDAAIVKSVVALAHSLEFGVVAEGVETEEQFKILSELGCDEIQGYLFSPPITLAAFTDLLIVSGHGPHRVEHTVSADQPPSTNCQSA